jgi:hypothetical protein
MRAEKERFTAASQSPVSEHEAILFLRASRTAPPPLSGNARVVSASLEKRKFAFPILRSPNQTEHFEKRQSSEGRPFSSGAIVA